MEHGTRTSGPVPVAGVLTVDLVAVVVEAGGVRHHLVGRDRDLGRIAATTLPGADGARVVRGVEPWRVQVRLS